MAGNSRKMLGVGLIAILAGTIACAGGAAPTATLVPTATTAPTEPPAPTLPPAPTEAAVDSGDGGKLSEEVNNAPDTITGTYTVEGTNPPDITGTYSGTLEISGNGQVGHLTWDIGGAISEGTAIWAGDSLIVAYPSDACILAVYQVNDAGDALEGVWVPPGSDTVAFETASVVEWDEASGILSMTISGNNPDGTTYTGGMALTKRGDFYEVAQSSGDTELVGTGIESGDLFGVSFGSGEGCAIAQYIVDGNTLVGTWGALSISEQAGVEILTKQ